MSPLYHHLYPFWKPLSEGKVLLIDKSGSYKWFDPTDSSDVHLREVLKDDGIKVSVWSPSSTDSLINFIQALPEDLYDMFDNAEDLEDITSVFVRNWDFLTIEFPFYTSTGKERTLIGESQ